jgi:hypothetical protein
VSASTISAWLQTTSPSQQFFLENRQPHHGAGLPVRERAGRADPFDAFNQQGEILHPRRENLVHQASGRLQAENSFGGYQPVHFTHVRSPELSCLGGSLRVKAIDGDARTALPCGTRNSWRRK